MVAPIGADVDLFLDAHLLRTDSFFLDQRTHADIAHVQDRKLT